MIESLHNHTTASDGILTYKELFELSESLGLGVIAFTDHDALPDIADIEYLDSVRNSKTKWVIGIEMTTKNPRGDGYIHIVGLFVNPTNEALIEHCKKMSGARFERMVSMLSNLHKLGFVITEEDCLRESEGESVARPHIVAALLKYKQNIDIIHRLVDEMRLAATHNHVIDERYKMMIERGFDKYAYELFLRPDSFIPAYVEFKYMLELKEVVKLIRDAGGVAIFAHYSSERKKISLALVDELLRIDTIDGVETIYGINKVDTSLEEEYEEDKVALREIAKQNNKLASGGADAHDSIKLQKYVDNFEFSKGSIGMARAILDSGKVGIGHKEQITSINW